MPAQLDLDTEQVAGNLQECRRCDLWRHAAILRAEGEHAVHLRTALIEDLTRARALGASDA